MARAKKSAGLLLHRNGGREVLLVHPGGPFWAPKDVGAWSIPKGEYQDGEDPLAVAQREFTEETGQVARGDFRPLGTITQAGGKRVTAWAVECDCDAAAIRSTTFTMEWPAGSGRMREFPEVDRAQWFSLDEARKRILKGQIAILDAFVENSP